MKWIASLNNGRTVTEASTNGNQSSWQAFLKYLRENPEVFITEMRLQHNDIVVMCIPGALGYVQCGRLRTSGLASGNPVTKAFRGIGAIIGSAVYMIWVSEDDKGLVYQSIEPFEGLSLHAWTQALVSA